MTWVASGVLCSKKLFVVRDDQDAHLGAADFGDALAGQPDGVGIQAAIGLVEDREFRLQHRELQNLGPLHLAAGEAVVHIPPGELRIHLQLLHLRPEFLAELLHRDQLFAFLAVGAADVRRGMAEEIGHPHAGNRHRPLKGHEDARPRPLVRLHVEHVESRAVVRINSIEPPVTS